MNRLNWIDYLFITLLIILVSLAIYLPITSYPDMAKDQKEQEKLRRLKAKNELLEEQLRNSYLASKLYEQEIEEKRLKRVNEWIFRKSKND